MCIKFSASNGKYVKVVRPTNPCDSKKETAQLSIANETNSKKASANTNNHYYAQKKRLT